MDSLSSSHNHDLERETDGFGYIHEMTLDELRRIDAGKKFPQFSPSKIPLLEEAVEAVPDDVLLNIEIKSCWGAGSWNRQIRG